MSITNFEDETTELTADELEFAGILQKIIESVLTPGVEKISSDFCYLINVALYEEYGIIGTKITPIKLRKWCNYFRSNSLILLIATSKGYSISTDEQIIDGQISSLMQRSNQIKKAAEGLKKLKETVKQLTTLIK